MENKLVEVGKSLQKLEDQIRISKLEKEIEFLRFSLDLVKKNMCEDCKSKLLKQGKEE